MRPLQDQSQADQDNSDQDLRWLNVRVLSLEAALADSRAEASVLSDYIELCVQMIKNQDERLSEQQQILQEAVDELAGRSSRNEQDLLDLRSSHNASSERADLAATEFLELATTANMLAAKVGNRAELNAEETELLRQRILVVDEEVRIATERLADELRDAERFVQEATVRLEAELRDADEEIRVMAEKATDRADFSVDTVAGLQADLDKASALVREKLAKVATHEELEEVERQSREELRRAAELVEAAKKQLREVISEPRDEVRSTPPSRFRYYIPEQKAPATEPKALPAADLGGIDLDEKVARSD